MNLDSTIKLEASRVNKELNISEPMRKQAAKDFIMQALLNNIDIEDNNSIIQRNISTYERETQMYHK